MGTYNLTIDELAEEITKKLDEVEGDFTRATLNKTLEKVKKEYPNVSDET